MNWWWLLPLAILIGIVGVWPTWRDAPEDPFDMDFPDSAPPMELDCPDTQPTSPGALDSDLARLK